MLVTTHCEEETEALSEAETEDTEGKYKVIIKKGEELGVTLDHEDGTFVLRGYMSEESDGCTVGHIRYHTVEARA